MTYSGDTIICQKNGLPNRWISHQSGEGHGVSLRFPFLNPNSRSMFKKRIFTNSPQLCRTPAASPMVQFTMSHQITRVRNKPMVLGENPDPHAERGSRAASIDHFSNY